MKRRIASALSLVTAVVLAAASAHAASPVLERVTKKGQLRVGMSGEQMPLNGLDASGKFIGLEPELAEHLAEAMNVELEIVKIPFPGLLPALQRGEVDLVMSGLTITPQRNIEFAFAGPYFVSGKSILTLSRELAMVADESDLDRKGLRLVALESSTSAAFVKTKLPKVKLVTTPSVTRGVQMVREAKVDAMVADMPTCVYAVLQDPSLATLAIPLTVEPIGIAVPGNDPLLVNLLDNYLEALSAAGELEELNRKWLRGGARSGAIR